MNAWLSPKTKAEPLDELDALAQEIKNEIAEVEEAFQPLMARAVRIGELLNDAKDKVKKKLGHGHWENWLAQNCLLPERTARSYMALAKDQRLKTANFADLKTLAIEDQSKGKRRRRKSKPPSEPVPTPLTDEAAIAAMEVEPADPVAAVQNLPEQIVAQLARLPDLDTARAIASAIVAGLTQAKLLSVPADA
jgi:hypothetical protein